MTEQEIQPARRVRIINNPERTGLVAPDPCRKGLQRIHFTQPEKFRAASIGAADFDRLSVAHGLSMGVETLMRITAKEASDPHWTAPS